MTDLAAIVARDAACGGPLPDSVLPEYQVLADRRALLALLRETREALAILYHSVTDGNGVRYHAAVPVLHDSRKVLDRLAALDEPAPVR